MSAGIALEYANADSLAFGAFDIALDDERLVETAVLLSLFTWRRARPDDDRDGHPRMGWWAGDFGSRLWLVSRAKITPGLPLVVRGYIEESLQWMVDDGLVNAVAVVTEINEGRNLYVRVRLLRTVGPAVELRFSNLFEHLIR